MHVKTPNVPRTATVVAFNALGMSSSGVHDDAATGF